MGKVDIEKNLYEAGLKLFQERGYYQTDIRSIAKEAEVSLGSFYNYYKDKKSLYLTIYEREYKKLSDSLVDSFKNIDMNQISNLKNLENVLTRHLIVHTHSLLFYIETEVLMFQDSDISGLKQSMEQDTTKRIAEILQNSVPDSVNLQYALPLIFSTVENSIQHILNRSSEDQRIIIKELAKMIKAYLFPI